MATISLQVAPAKYQFDSQYESLYYHNGNAHPALHKIYVLAKQDMEAKCAEPPQKKRRLNQDIQTVNDEDYIVLARARIELVCQSNSRVTAACSNIPHFYIFPIQSLTINQELIYVLQRSDYY